MRVTVPFATFFSILCGYFVLRPVRDEIGARAGIEKLPWLFTATFIATLLLVPLFGWIVSRVRRRVIATWTYAICSAAVLAVFFGLRTGTNETAWGVGLFVGISVLNLFMISVFWSLMADSYDETHARQMYGIIAAGGTAGAVAGPALTALLAPKIGPMNLLPISATFLALASLLTLFIPRRSDTTERKIGGNVLAGVMEAFRSPTLLRVVVIIICYTTISGILYFEQADIVKKTIADSGERTRFFALLDLTNNIVTILTQALITSRVLTTFGLRTALTAAPALIGTGLVALAAFPRLALIAVLQVIHRVGEHGFTRPGREVIFTTVTPEERYKAKNFIDTFVYRGNDALVAWLVGLLHTAGAGIATIGLLGAGVAAGWAANGYILGTRHDRDYATPLRDAHEADPLDA
jgi:AAA family ATP:ADP antiporter